MVKLNTNQVDYTKIFGIILCLLYLLIEWISLSTVAYIFVVMFLIMSKNECLMTLNTSLLLTCSLLSTLIVHYHNYQCNCKFSDTHTDNVFA